MSGTALRFPLADLVEQLEAFALRWPQAVADRAGLVFAGGPGAALRVPMLAPRVVPGERVRAYLARITDSPDAQDAAHAGERHVVLLLRAGAMAVGCWSGGELLHHKAIRRYVVRGHGKAQPLHAKTRGKSRYGARLRLQNWQRLLRETNARLRAYRDDHGEPQRIFVAVPVRAWSDLFAADPAPPFSRDDPRLQRVPMHVHRPDFAELMRVHAWLGHGRLELPPA